MHTPRIIATIATLVIGIGAPAAAQHPACTVDVQAYFDNFRSVMERLRSIAEKELAEVLV